MRLLEAGLFFHTLECRIRVLIYVINLRLNYRVAILVKEKE